MMAGHATLMDEIAAGAPQGLADDLWRLAYTRGHLDVDPARPYVDHDHAGILVYARSVDALKALLVVDNGKRLIGAAGAWGPLPRIGSAVRLVAAAPGGAPWRLIVDEPLALSIGVRFDRVPSTREERRWIGVLRDALEVIRSVEIVRRDVLAARRRELPALAAVQSVEELVRAHVADLRCTVERETEYTAEEAAELDAARCARLGGAFVARRRAHEREAAIVRARQERFDASARIRLEAFRAQLPGLRERVRRAEAGNDVTRAELRRIENAYGESRARTAATYAASRWLDGFADAAVCVSGLDAPLRGFDDASLADDVLRAIALLARALPRTGSRRAV